MLRKFLSAFSSRAVVLFLLLAALLLLFFLYRSFDPSSSRLAPKCPFKFFTGLDCPGCGSQRALHALLQGNFVEAFWYNPFLWLVMPYLLALLLTMFLGEGTSRTLYSWLRSRTIVYLYLLMFLFWWVFRNTPFWENLLYII
uniref:DUF2752 domain-containing protein n=1 Tax=Alistipes sp. TaxID=1872444 RepID=UPI004055EB1F